MAALAPGDYGVDEESSLFILRDGGWHHAGRVPLLLKEGVYPSFVVVFKNLSL